MTKRISLLIVLLIIGFFVTNVMAEFCCERTGLGAPIPMPPEQESDCTGYIHSARFSAVHSGGVFSCPIQWSEYSYGGREVLNQMIDEFGRIAGAPADSESQAQMENMQDVNYVWQATLTLNNMGEKVSGQIEEGYLPGSQNYVQGYVIGDWTLNLKLVNSHFNEVVEQASMNFSGTCSDEGAEAARDMINAYFTPIGETVYEYEKVPMTCDIEPEEDPIEAGEETTITIDVKDEQGESPKSWQRIVVDVEEGDILNGEECIAGEKAKAFKCGNGQVKVTYKAKEDCEDKTETFKVYNSCQWGQEAVRPMRITDKSELIGEKQVDVVDLQPSSCTIDPEKEKINPNESITINLSEFIEPNGRELRPKEKIMVKAKEGKILNGKSHEEYKIFPIGNGMVEVLYEAPDMCGIDKDNIEIYNVCENQEEGKIEPDKKIAQKGLDIKKVSCDLTVDIKASFRWRSKRGNHIEGNGTMTIKGDMKFDEKNQLPMVKRYVPGKMIVSITYKSAIKDPTPSKGCPELVSEFLGGGSSSMPDPRAMAGSSLEIRRFGNLFPKDMPIPIPAEAKSFMQDHFQLVLGGAKMKPIPGKVQKSGGCGRDKCPCREYTSTELNISAGSVVLRGKIDESGKMSGSRSWTGQGARGRMGFQLDDVGDDPDFRPRALTIVGDEFTIVNVSWTITVYN